MHRSVSYRNYLNELNYIEIYCVAVKCIFCEISKLMTSNRRNMYPYT